MAKITDLINNMKSIFTKPSANDTSFEPSCYTKNNNSIDIENTGTYLRIISLLPSEALSSLPKDVYKALGHDFITAFKQALVNMRKIGVGYVILAKRTQDNKITPFCVKEGSSDNQQKYEFLAEYDETEKTYKYYYAGEIINPQSVIVFGNQFRLQEARLVTHDEQKRSIAMYEEMLYAFANKVNNSYAFYVKLDGLEEGQIVNSLEYQFLQQKLKNIANRSANSVVYLSSKDEIGFTQMALEWFPNTLHEYKIKICLDYNIPYTKLFGEGATGLSATGEGDRRTWYDAVKSFQSLYIYPALKQLASAISPKSLNIINQIDLEEIEIEDKERLSAIAQTEINTASIAYSNDGISHEDYHLFCKKVLNINCNQPK